MANRLVLGCALALMMASGCGGGDTMGADSGTDTGGGGGTDSGLDSGQDAFVSGPDAGTDAATTMDDAGLSDGCELGNTYPALGFASLHSYGDVPVGIVLAPGRNELFVVLRGGTVVITDPTTGATSATPFLDISGRLGGSGPGGMSEWGLLGLAFHPDYATNGLFYVAYTAQVGGTVVGCDGRSGARFEDRVAVGNRSAASSDQGTFGADIFVVMDPKSNHNGGQLGFGPDGYLYYGLGDGGEQGDPCARAQDTSLPLGKIHRFEVGPGIATYNPAPGNPFIAGGGLDTIWAYGLRNPWRFNWDRRTGSMYIADVGQDDWEEVDVVAAGTGAGTNFGWSVCEGTHDYNGTCATLTGDVAPIAEYPHAGGLMHGGGNASVTGGYVYRGSAIPALRGAYLYADEVTSYFAALRNCPGMPVTQTALADLSDSLCQNPTTFGEDRGGELLVGCYADGSLYRIVAP